jgi:hypothetical protein
MIVGNSMSTKKSFFFEKIDHKAAKYMIIKAAAGFGPSKIP